MLTMLLTLLFWIYIGGPAIVLAFVMCNIVTEFFEERFKLPQIEEGSLPNSVVLVVLALPFLVIAGSLLVEMAQ